MQSTGRQNIYNEATAGNRFFCTSGRRKGVSNSEGLGIRGHIAAIAIAMKATDAWVGFAGNGALEERPVRTGLSSRALTEVVAGLAEGERVLDACAAPGGKTACLDWAAGENGRVVAGERSSRRLALLKRNCVRIRADLAILRMDAMEPPFHQQFDLVLVDAPCSGLGVFRRHPDARWRLEEADLGVQACRQRAILRGAARAVRSGGRLVYSVCTNEPEETEEVAASFREPGFVPIRDGGALPEGAKRYLKPDGSLRITPGNGLDGFFAVSWRKEGGNC